MEILQLWDTAIAVHITQLRYIYDKTALQAISKQEKVVSKNKYHCVIHKFFEYLTFTFFV